MKRKEFNELRTEIISHTKDITRKAIDWDVIVKKVEGHPPYESGQIDDHFENAFNEVLNTNIFRRSRIAERQLVTIPLGEHKLVIAVGHMVKGLEDVEGFDLIYYVSNWKAVVFQHKKRDKEGRISITAREARQKEKMKSQCNECHQLNDHRESFIIPYCSSLYVIGDRSTSPVDVVSTCRLSSYLELFPDSNSNSQKSLPLVPDRSTVDMLFLSCLVGNSGKWDPNFTQIEIMKDIWKANNHVVVEAGLDRELQS